MSSNNTLTQQMEKAFVEYSILEQRPNKLPVSQQERLKLYPTATCTTNSHKNRYFNVLPAEGTRVVLEGSNNYINANLIDFSEDQIISCQAPTPDTFADFWQMVWQKNSPLIVMLTRLFEKGCQKADTYWPASMKESITQGDIVVKLKDVSKINNDLTFRKFKLSIGEETKEVFQLHFTSWPDFGVPQVEQFMALLNLTEHVLKYSVPSSAHGPPIVHCSAGVGRTGVFIACRLALKQLRQDKTPDILNIVHTLREQRHGMVQTKEQYAFIHLVVNHFLVLKENRATEESELARSQLEKKNSRKDLNKRKSSYETPESAKRSLSSSGCMLPRSSGLPSSRPSSLPHSAGEVVLG